MSVKIKQDETMTISGSSNWEKRKSFLSEEDGTYIEWTTYFRPPDSSWRLKRESLYKGCFGRRVSRCDDAGFVRAV
jgi:wyosine [tRNA(Phe)-imidazoG37] synthetase (radical SAM superfamily)